MVRTMLFGPTRYIGRHCAQQLETAPSRSEPTRMASAGSQLRALNRLRAEALRDLAIGIDASLSGEIDGPVCSVSIAGPRGP